MDIQPYDPLSSNNLLRGFGDVSTGLASLPGASTGISHTRHRCSQQTFSSCSLITASSPQREAVKRFIK